jgi:phage recombination protein Bet
MEESARNQWPRERIELVRRAICPKGMGDDEFALFIEQCKRSGLDPLLKEAFCVPRSKKLSAKGQPEKWETVHEFQPSEAGMLARAERFPDFKGIQASAAYAEDEILVDQGKGEVVHRFNPAKRKGALVGAWARVVREGKLPVVVWLDLAGYVQQTPLWAKIPTTMIEKCARVAALRKAYPEAFGGLYVNEELPPEEDGAAAPPEVATSAREVTSTRPAEVTDFPPKQAEPLTRPPARPTQPAAPQQGALVGFGPHARKALGALSSAEARECLEFAARNIAASPGKSWEQGVRKTMAEIASREALISHEALGGMIDMANEARTDPDDAFRRAGASVLLSILEPEAGRRALLATPSGTPAAKPAVEHDVPF